MTHIIRRLTQNLINQIAAGEVIERPSSALKELIENAIDADATQIEVSLDNGGKSYLSVTDNGKGMNREDLALSIERHATSKLPEDNLFDIHSFGFRGEALASIASVAKLKISTKERGATEAFSLEVWGGDVQPIKPAAQNTGTQVEVKELFFATPARLKFLKSDKSELLACKEVIQRLALAYPHVSFKLYSEGKLSLHYPPTKDLLDRADAVLSKQFRENVLPVQAEHDSVKLSGFIGLTTYLRTTTTEQFLYVNGRFVKDKMLNGCLKAAYQGLIGHEGHPVAVLFLTVPAAEIDVNVHPAKTEVRFKDAGVVRGLIVGCLKSALAEAGHRTATTIGIGALGATTSHFIPPSPARGGGYSSHGSSHPTNDDFNRYLKGMSYAKKLPEKMAFADSKLFEQTPYSAKVEKPAPQPETDDFPPLGLARCQVMNTYILSQTPDSMIITDQHAAHERLTYEKIQEGLRTHQPQTQLLLIPEIVSLSEYEAGLLSERSDELKDFGLVLDLFGKNAVAVREIPALLGEKCDIPKLIQDVADTLKEFDQAMALSEKMKDICARMACHTSVRAGRKLTVDEMNALLRQMESCGTSGQCIHGRPTYIELKIKDIERLFGRR